MPKSILKLRKHTTNDAMMHLCCRKGFVRVTSNCVTSIFSGTLIINGDCNFIMQITKWPSGFGTISAHLSKLFFFLMWNKSIKNFFSITNFVDVSCCDVANSSAPNALNLFIIGIIVINIFLGYSITDINSLSRYWHAISPSLARCFLYTFYI